MIDHKKAWDQAYADIERASDEARAEHDAHKINALDAAQYLMDVALAAATYEPQPLTEAQLKERVGRPIYIVDTEPTAASGWDVVGAVDRYFLETARFYTYPLEECGKTWLAYDQEPGVTTE